MSACITVQAVASDIGIFFQIALSWPMPFFPTQGVVLARSALLYLFYNKTTNCYGTILVLVYLLLLLLFKSYVYSY